MRAGLFLRASGLDFEEIEVALFSEGWKERIARYSPAGRVPVLLDGDLAVWDTMAIFEHVIERHGERIDWPREAGARARTRSVAAEMHAGFLALREELPLNVRARHERFEPSAAAEAETAAIDFIGELRDRKSVV